MNNIQKYTIIGIIIVTFILYSQKSKNESELDINENDMTSQRSSGLSKVIQDYGVEYAKNVERLLRWETAHFKSRQWKNGSTAGMEATTEKFPFGWSSLKKFVNENNISENKFSTYKMIENNTGITKTFIKFPDEFTFIIFLAWFIRNVRNNRFGYWYSTNEENARRYEEKISKVIPRIVNELI
jgi:hypothetical protein